MNTKPKRIGEALIEAGLLSRMQLQRALQIQDECAYRSFGDIITSAYGIPSEKIESAFVNLVLLPALNDLLIHHLKTEENKFTSHIPIKADQLIYDIEIQTLTLKKTISSSFSKNDDQELVSEPRRSTSTELSGMLNLTIRTQEKEIICERNRLTFTYESDTGSAQLDGSTITGLQFRFKQKNKERLGEKISCSPITEQELREVLEHL